MQAEEAPDGTGPTQQLQLLQEDPYLRDAPPEIDRAWAVTEALIATLKAEVERDGATFSMAVLPTTPEIVRQFRSTSFADRWDIDRSLDRIQQICDRLEASCLQLVESFREPGVDVDDSYWPEEGHWTPIGHRVAADGLYAWLKDPLCGP